MLATAKYIGAAIALRGLGRAGIGVKSTFFHKYYSTSSSVGPSKENLPAFATKGLRVFFNVLSERNEISKYLKGKSGVYCWVNLINGKYYIGSGVELNVRVSDYFQNSYLKNKNNLPIVKAILKYGLGNFALVILEFTDKENLLSREDHYLKSLSPEYNILENAGNSLGYKHTLESIKKITDSVNSRLEELREWASERKGEKNPFFGKTHTAEAISKISEAKKGHITSSETRTKLSNAAKKWQIEKNKSLFVEILDLTNNTATVHSSINEAARSLNINVSSLLNWEKKNSLGTKSPYKGRYIFTINRP